MADKIKITLKKDDIVTVLIGDDSFLVLNRDAIDPIDVPFNRQTVEKLVELARECPDLLIKATDG